MVGLGKLGEVVFLKRYMRPGAKDLTPEGLGRHIDDALVEYTYLKLPDPKLGEVRAEDFNSAMVEIEEGRRENPALRAFGARLWRDEGLPLASDTYLYLARRHIRRLTNIGTQYQKRLPSPGESCQFARAALDPFIRKPFSGTDWEIKRFTRIEADRWLRNPSLYKLFKLVIDSKKSAVAFDILQLITRGLDDAIEERPALLLHWNFEVASGQRTRPAEGHGPRHRHKTLGYMLRDNEIRHTVRLLEAVGCTKTAGYKAVAEAFKIARELHFPEAVKLSESTIRGICDKPFSTIPELQVHAMERIEPDFHSHLNGPGSSFSPSD